MGMFQADYNINIINIINHTYGSTVTEMSENETNRIQGAYVPLHLHDNNFIVNYVINKFYKSVKNAIFFYYIYIYIYIYNIQIVNINQGFMQDQIIASHTCFGRHMDVNC